MATQEQRILDLALAGHNVGDIASLLDVTPEVVNEAVQDLTNNGTGVLGGSSVPAQASAPAIVSGTPAQDATGLPSEVYVGITGHAAGTVTVAIGPTNAVADTIINAADASVNRTVSFRLPASWWYEVTVAGQAAIAGAKQITG